MLVLKALIALSLEMSFTVFFKMVHRWMYERIDSFDLYVHACSFSMEAGRF
jgi:hypothetical protein